MLFRQSENQTNAAISPGSGGGVEVLLVGSCYRNQDKLQPNGPLGP